MIFRGGTGTTTTRRADERMGELLTGATGISKITSVREADNTYFVTFVDLPRVQVNEHVGAKK